MDTQKTTERVIDPIAYTIKDACSAAGCGKSKLYEAIAAGELTPRKLGRRTLILAEDLKRWVRSLPVET